MKFPSELKEIPFNSERYRDLIDTTTAIDERAGTPDAIIELSRDNDQLREAIAGYLEYRHPSQIYQALMEGLALFLILFAVRLKWKRLPYGFLTAFFFIGYATFRIIGEHFRHPDAGNFPGTDLSKGQFYSLFMYAVGTIFIAYAFYERKFRAPLKETRLDVKFPAQRNRNGESNESCESK
jgi:phosphatidylglycerol:prolipoprotein diacylglycerol transferase